VDVVHGQKTGFYLDQRDARDCVERLAAGTRMLDVFSYTGGFAVAAARGGARSVTLLDSSRAALEQAVANPGLAEADCAVETRAGDAFEALRAAAGRGETWELLVVDPPPLARRRGDVAAAGRAYKDLVLHAARSAAPGAYLLVFSCSHHVGPEQLLRHASAAAVDAGRTLRVERRFGAPADHPVSVHHPEGEYLHGLLLRVSPAGGEG
jgi:23S rRNA (cytosine1962-C5)-methyltransferase